MHFVIKMVVDHHDIGDVIVGTLNVEKHHWECYPVEDDAEHVLGAPAPAALTPPPPVKAPAPTGGAFAVVEKTVRSGKRIFREIRAACIEAGYSKSGVGSLLVKALARGIIVQNEDRKYFMPDERPDLVGAPSRPKKQLRRHKSMPGASSIQLILDSLGVGPKKRIDLERTLKANGFSPTTAGPTLNKLKRAGVIWRTMDDYWALIEQKPGDGGTIIAPGGNVITSNDISMSEARAAE